MPTNFDTTFTTGHVIQATHILQAFEPIERLETGESFFGEDAGGGDPSAYVITLDPPPPDPLPAGFMAHFKAGSTNTGAATLQLNSLDPLDLVGPVNEALDAGTIQNGQMVAALFDGTRFQLVGATPPLELADLVDVDPSGATTGDVLSFDGAEWVPGTLAGSGTSLGTLVDVDLTSPADNQVLRYDSGTSKWENGTQTLDSLSDVVAGSPAAGMVLAYDGSDWKPVKLPRTPDNPPASPAAADDEFDGTSFDTAGTRFSGANAWAWRNQGSATAVLADGHLVLTAPASGSDNHRIVEQTAPGGSWKYRLKMSDLRMTESNYACGAIVIANSSNGKFIAFQKAYSGGVQMQLDRYNSVTSHNTTLVGSFIFSTRSPHHALYLEVESDGTTLTFRYSDSGVDGTYITFGSDTISSFLGTADRIGISADSVNSNVVQTVVDWFRRVA